MLQTQPRPAGIQPMGNGPEIAIQGFHLSLNGQQTKDNEYNLYNAIHMFRRKNIAS